MPYMYESSSDDEVRVSLHTSSPSLPKTPEKHCPAVSTVATITRLFRLQVASHPFRSSIECEDQPPISYESLDQLSNKLAATLLQCDDRVIAVCLQRSPELIISILSILKAGRAYVVLDPHGSQERNNLVIHDASINTVLADSAHASRYRHGVDVVKVLENLAIDSSPASPPDIEISPDSLAYIIYTSGSIGRPKGVLISHRAAATGISHFSLNNKKRWLLFYNPTFSAAQRTMLATLCKGGCVCLAKQDRLISDLSSVIHDMRIEALGITPSMLATLSVEAIPSSLKQILTVGEPLGELDVSPWIVKLEEFRVSYGLSECAQLNMSRQLRLGDSTNVVGQPCDSTSARIIEINGITDLKNGEEGELCLQGPQLSDGYLNLPAETQNRFVEGPHGSGRMFRTGDLARRLADGSIEILGRVDRQMKINGQRLDPEEVSSVLCQHQAVCNATIIATEIKEEYSLVAAVSSVETFEWNVLVEELRSLATLNLPSYMVPRFWLHYKVLPKSANGKLDWSKIKQDAQAVAIDVLLARGDRSTSSWEEISDEHEILIRDVWASILHLNAESISRRDSFLSLGGSSMTAIRMINELRKQGVEMSLESFFSQDDIVTISSKTGPTSTSTSSTSTQTPSYLSAFSLMDDGDLKELLKEQRVTNAYPVTDFQESVLTSIVNGRTHYTYQRKWTVDHCDIHRLQLAFHVQFLRSNTLRTSFVSTEFGLMQVVRSSMNFPWQVLDESVDDYVERDLQAGFTLGEPMWRAAVLNGCVLVVTMHHALFDFWSHHFLYDDVAALYKGLPSQRRPEFDHFVSYVCKSDHDQAKAFWTRHLQESTQTLLNPYPTRAITRQTRTVDLTLDKLATSAGVASGVLIQFAWALCLSTNVRSDDVVFAVTFSGRDLPVDDIDILDGPTVTIVPRRVRFEPNKDVQTTLNNMHEESWELLKYSQYGLRRALKASSLAPTDFDTMVNILPARPEALHTSSDVFKQFGDRPQWKTEHTVLQVQVESDRVDLELSSRMESLRAKFILESFGAILEQISWRLNQPVSSVEVMATAEIDFLQKPAVFPQECPEHMLYGFDESVVSRPESIALQWQNTRSITYQELNTLSNQLANLLRFHGVKKGDRVCLYLEKAPFMIVSILACLKAGVVYVPLSPENPMDRNSFIALDTEAVLTISQPHMENAREISHIVLQLCEADLALFSPLPSRSNLTRNDPSYIIYTSGSTGQPKGCIITHGAAAAAVSSMIKVERRQNGKPFRTLQFASYAFDASILEIFNTLSSGATLCMAAHDRMLSDLPGVINEMQVNHAFFTPTVLRLLTPHSVPSLKNLTVGGEALSADIVESWSGPTYHMCSAYGPTETAIACAMKVMSSCSNPTNLGHPLDTVHCFILDREADQLIPYGAVGELCIAGPQVGAGYWKRPEATEEVFRVLSTNDSEGLRYYRSGDLARWLPDGEIEYLGRKDHQVKIHGHRIELGEIERTFLSNEAVHDCVTVVANIDGKVQLASFVIFEPGEEQGVQATELFVEQVRVLHARMTGLAQYMVPKYVLPLYALPLTAGGKADRKKLEALFRTMDGKEMAKYCFDTFGQDSSGSLTAYEAPQTDVEKCLAKGFSLILDLSTDVRVGRTSNFLSLGGDSISAINLTSFLRKHGYQLSVSNIFKNPTLQHMSLQLQGNGHAPSSDLNVGESSPSFAIADEIRISGLLEEAGRSWNDVEYTYSCPPGQNEFLEQGSKASQGWVLMTVRLFEDDIDSWTHAVTKLTEINDILRTTYMRHSSKPSPAWIGLVLKSECAAPRVDVIQLTAESRDHAIDNIWRSPFRFGEPFIRYTLLVHPDGKQELVTKMDHALYDGTLLRVWASQFSSIQKNLPLPEVTEFRDFATHMYQGNQQSVLRFWKSQLRPTPFNFPTVVSRQSTWCTDARVETLIKASSLDLQSDFESVVSKSAVTTPVLFQAAFQLWVSQAASKASSLEELDIAYDYLYTGRNVALPNPQSINGTCATFVPFRSRIDLRTPIITYLIDTQDMFWAATENATIGLGQMYAAADLDRSLCQNKTLFLFQPFDAPVKQVEQDQPTEMKFVYMAGAQVKMLQPYALVCEVKKIGGSDFKVQLTYDRNILSHDDAQEGAEGIRMMFRNIVAAVEAGDRRVGDVMEME